MDRERKRYKRGSNYLKREDAATAPIEPVRHSDVFVSHSSQDKPLLDAFARMLSQGCGLANHRIFYSSNSDLGVYPGEEINRSVRNNLQHCQITISVVTPHYIHSPYCLAEAGAIWALEKKSLIFVCPPLSLSDVKPPVDQHRTLNLTSARDLDTAFDILRSTLHVSQTSTGLWNEERDIFISTAGISRQRFDASRERGVAAIAAEIPIPVATFVELLDRIPHAGSVYTILVDIDRLTQINQLYGFPFGSILLDEVNSLIEGFAQRSREILIASRCGDDTFFLVVFGEENDVEHVARNVLNDINRIPAQIGRPEVTLTASSGIAAFIKNGDAKGWFERAYHGCEEARRKGGNRVEVARTNVQRSWS